MTTKEKALAELDLAICWECADTRPVFAHETCQKIDSLLLELKDLLGTKN